jgi:hypothetical protein
MANLSFRKLDDDVFLNTLFLPRNTVFQWKKKFARFLKKTVLQQVKLGDLALQLFGNEQGIELELMTDSAHKPMDLIRY